MDLAAQVSEALGAPCALEVSHRDGAEVSVSVPGRAPVFVALSGLEMRNLAPPDLAALLIRRVRAALT